MFFPNKCEAFIEVAYILDICYEAIAMYSFKTTKRCCITFVDTVHTYEEHTAHGSHEPQIQAVGFAGRGRREWGRERYMLDKMWDKSSQVLSKALKCFLK